jgi:hypothetical protein
MPLPDLTSCGERSSSGRLAFYYYPIYYCLMHTFLLSPITSKRTIFYALGKVLREETLFSYIANDLTFEQRCHRSLGYDYFDHRCAQLLRHTEEDAAPS